MHTQVDVSAAVYVGLISLLTVTACECK